MKTILFCCIFVLLMSSIVFGGEGEKYLKEVFDNGLTVIIKHNPDSRVFAIDILGKNRAAMEKSEKTGITDFVNRMLVKGTLDKDAEEIQAALDDIGAKLQTNDNPYIPYDDRYTWRAFSFLRFETIDEYAEDGVKLLYEIVAEANFPEAEVEKMKNQVMGILGMSSGSTYKVCRDIYYDNLFVDHPLSRPEMGSPRSVGGFTKGDLEYHHRVYYNPPNLIMTVVSNIEPEKVMKWIKKKFKNMSKYPVDLKDFVIPEARKKTGIIEANQPMEKEQVYIYLGNIVPGLKSEGAMALTMAVEILSSRLKLNLREEQGLAYSVGAGVRYLGDFGWFTASIGTGFENFETALTGILTEMDKLKTEPLVQAELDKARNSLWGSMLMRNMSCINQAYNMAYYEYVGVGYDYDDTYRDRLDNVSIEDVRLAAERYFDTENYVLSYVGKVAGAESETNAE